MDISLKDLIKMNLQPDMIEGICKHMIKYNPKDEGYWGQNKESNFVEEIKGFIEEFNPSFDHWVYSKFKSSIDKFYLSFNPHTLPEPERFLTEYLKEGNNHDSTWNAFAIKLGKKDIQSLINGYSSRLPREGIEALDKEKVDLTPFFKDTVDRKKFNLAQEFFGIKITNYKLPMDELGVKYLRMIGQLEYHYSTNNTILSNLTVEALKQCTSLQAVRILYYYLKKDTTTLLNIGGDFIDKLVFTFRFQNGVHKREAEYLKERFISAGGKFTEETK